MEVFGDLQTKPNRDHNFKSPSMQQVYASDRFIYIHHLQSRQDLTFCRKKPKLFESQATWTLWHLIQAPATPLQKNVLQFNPGLLWFRETVETLFEMLIFDYAT